MILLIMLLAILGSMLFAFLKPKPSPKDAHPIVFTANHEAQDHNSIEAYREAKQDD